MKKILLVSYGDYDYDGRLRELIKVFDNIGTLYCYTRGSEAKSAKHKLFSGKSYLGFIKSAVSFGKKIGNFDVLVLDNRRATIPGLMLKKSLKPKVVIQDCRELYISKDMDSFVSKVGCFFESKMIEKADIIISANKKRAEIMQQMYSLKKEPLVYENLRKLEYDRNNRSVYEKKYADILKNDEYRIISTSGCSISRTNDVLVENISQINHKVRVLLVGGSTHEDIVAIRKICKDKHIDNVEIIDNLEQDELKWLIQQSHIGVVNYNQNDLNNKYCASGKIYEFVYEGKPVITTTNPPLMDLCDEYQIGEPDDEYYIGINKIIENYDFYKERVENFTKLNTVENNNERIIDELILQIEKSKKDLS